MKHLAIGFALAAALLPTNAGAQAGSPHSGHGMKPPAEGKAATAAAPVAPAYAKYASPFADYRPFTPQEPPKGWRAANDEVREVGGHVGLMKGAGTKSETAKGAKP